jgi:signal transduction histidine kinase/streptogramin lyase
MQLQLMKRNRYWLVLLFYGLLGALCAQQEKMDYVFECNVFDRSMGFRGNTPTSVVQDSMGFLWAANHEGINRFNGSRFAFYPKAVFGIEVNHSLILHADKKGLIWLQSGEITYLLASTVYGVRNNSLKIFNPYLQVFWDFDVLFPNAPFCERDVLLVNHNPAQELFFALYDGRIYSYDGVFKLEHQVSLDQILRYYTQNSRGDKYVAQKDFLKVFDQKGHQMSSELLPVPIRDIRLWQDSVAVLSLISKTEYAKVLRERIWIKEGRAPAQPLRIKGAYLQENARIIGIDESERLWVLNKDSILVAERGPEGISAIFSVYFTDIFPFLTTEISWGHSNAIWVVGPGKMAYMSLRPNLCNSMLGGIDCSVRGLAEVDSNRLLVSTYKGVMEVDIRAPSAYRKIESLGEYPYGICKAGDTFWFGNHGRHVERYSPGSNQTVRYELRLRDSLNWSDTQVPYVDQQGKVWLGMRFGLGILRPGEDKITVLSASHDWKSIRGAQVRQFFFTNEGLWIATSNGIFLVDPVKEKIIGVYRTPLGGNIAGLTVEESGNLWIVLYRDDLVYWDRTRNRFTSYDLYSLEIDNTLHGVIPDQNGNLWLPSNKGLYRFTPSTQQLRVFLESDGLPSNELNANAYLALSDGRIAVGGLDGFALFHPEKILRQTQNVNVLRLDALNAYDYQTDNTINLLADFYGKGVITMPADSRELEVAVCFPSYNPVFRQYFYRLNPSGADAPWLPLKDGRLLINQLEYGRSVLELKGRADLELPNSGIITIPIELEWPWYLRWWAFTFYISCLLLSTWLFTILRLRTQRAINQQLEGEVEQRTRQLYQDKLLIEEQNTELARLNEFKDRILGLIGHELKSPMIGLMDMADKLSFLVRNNRWEDIARTSKIIDHRVIDMRHTLENLLNWAQRTPDARMVRQHIDAQLLLQTEWTQLAGIAAAKGISLQLAPAVWPRVFMDPLALSVVLRNVLHNAIKFSPANGHISVKAENTPENWLLISICNPGAGFPTDFINRFAEPHFYFSSKGTAGESGTGLGLRLCVELMKKNEAFIKIANQPTQGACVLLSLPTTES